MNQRAMGEAALLGTAAGMRSMLPLAALGVTLPLRRAAGVPLAIAAIGELVYDKLPQAKDRTLAPSVAARVGTGALAGGIAARVFGASVALGAATGALAALASTFLFHRLRAGIAARVPPLTAALGEDLIAIGTTAAAIRLSR